MFETIEKSMAVSILGHDVYDDLQEWVTEIQEIEADYVVFVVRRSFVLVQILTNLRKNDINQHRMIDDFSYITDSAILILCDRIAEFYRKNGYFPTILLCDDILIHGRNINHLIEDIENRMKSILLDDKNNDLEKKALLFQLEKAIRIFVYTCSMDSVLLEKRYEPGLRIKRPASASFSHVLSSNIATLIAKSRVANASYVRSAFVRWDDRFEEWIRTDYQDNIQHSLIIPIKRKGRVKALATYRLTEKGAKQSEQMQIVPFVFLPRLDSEETERIYIDIMERMKKNHYYEDCDREFVKTLYDIQGRRMFYELVSLIHSEAMLKDFFSKYQYQNNNNECKDFEINKLVRNYFNGNQDFIKQFLNKLIDHSLIASQTELELHLDQCIDEDTYIIDDSFIELSFQYENYHTSGNSIENKNIKRIIQNMENLFFWQGMKEEIEAKKAFYNPSLRPVKTLKRTIYNCADALSTLVAGMNDLIYTMAYFLQMMDAGIIGISSNGGTDGKIDGFCQFEKPGEQSLLILPLRNMKYIPFLKMLCEFCEEFDLRKKTILNMFYRKEGWLDEYEETVLFLDILENMGHHPRDWMGDYSRRIKEEHRSELLKNRNNYLNKFKDFILETPRNYFMEYGRIRDEEN